MRHAAVTETTLFGDASAAEGVELCFGGTSDSKLSWEHRWRFGGSGTLDPAETDADRAQQNALHVQSTSFTCGNPQEQEAVTLAWPDRGGKAARHGAELLYAGNADDPARSAACV